ncbi:cell division protein FtsL [Methylocapsa acidiphila]|uniref:cell division protein FtsL n=1 Tax=Methylocapsa acidiphila TaxID=133552 RepID=UPI0003F4F51E|nr:cell division protein FtsL [Methylocapsa acidiphila]
MVRILNLLAVVALIGSAIYAYSIKYETIYHAERIVKLKHEIKAEQDQIGMLRAEWAHLTRPERIQALADKLLDLQPVALTQIVGADALPSKAQKIDSIGRKMELLGLTEPTNTPRIGAGAPATPAMSPR